MPVVDHAAAGQVQSRAADVIGIAGAGDQARAGDETRAFIAGDLTLPEPKPGLLGIVERLGGAVVESTGSGRVWLRHDGDTPYLEQNMNNYKF